MICLRVYVSCKSEVLRLLMCLCRKFWMQLRRCESGSCEGLKFAVFALGDSNYTKFCHAVSIFVW